MKILIYGINFAPELTGVGKYSGEMVDWLCAKGHEIRVVTAPPYYPAWRVSAGYSAWRYRKDEHSIALEGAGSFSKYVSFVVYRCPVWVPLRPSGLKRILHLLSFFISSMPVMLRQVFWRPDLVWVVEPPLFCVFGAKLTASLCGSKAWLHVQDFEVDAAFDLGILKGNVVRRLVMAMERRLMRCFDVVSTISGRMLDRLNIKGVQEDRRVLFPNWVDTKAIFPIEQPASSLPPLLQGQRDSMRHALCIPDDAVVALYSGNMGEKQGLEIVIEAAHILESVQNIRFVMCGQGAAFQRLRNLSEGMRNISWLPLQPLERLNELLNLADIHLLPQRSDAADLVMPSKLTGILASGKPVVATAAEGTEVWSVVDGCGVNTPPGDAVAFAMAIRDLAGDAARRAMFGKAGRHYAEECLDTDVVLGRFEAELMRVVGR